MEALFSCLAVREVCYTATMYNERGSFARPRVRDRWGIVFKFEGETVYTCRGERIVSDAKNAVILPRGCSYEWRCTESGRYAIVEFDADESYDRILSCPVTAPGELLNRMERMEYRMLQKRGLYRFACLKDVYSLLLSLLEGEKKYVPSERARMLSPAYEHIVTHYTEPLSNDVLASLVGVSTVWFRKLFKDVYGVSPISFARSLRMERAKEMLVGDFGTVSDVAVSLGYANVYDFSRDFKRHIGIPPSEYAKRNA